MKSSLYNFRSALMGDALGALTLFFWDCLRIETISFHRKPSSFSSNRRDAVANIHTEISNAIKCTEVASTDWKWNTHSTYWNYARGFFFVVVCIRSIWCDNFLLFTVCLTDAIFAFVAEFDWQKITVHYKRNKEKKSINTF